MRNRGKERPGVPCRRGWGDAGEVLRRSRSRSSLTLRRKRETQTKEIPEVCVSLSSQFSHVFYFAGASQSPAGWEDADGCGPPGFCARLGGSGVHPADPGCVVDTQDQPVQKREGRRPSLPCPHRLEYKTARREAVTCWAPHGPCQGHDPGGRALRHHTSFSRARGPVCFLASRRRCTRSSQGPLGGPFEQMNSLQTSNKFAQGLQPESGALPGPQRQLPRTDWDIIVPKTKG